MDVSEERTAFVSIYSKDKESTILPNDRRRNCRNCCVLVRDVVYYVGKFQRFWAVHWVHVPSWTISKPNVEQEVSQCVNITITWDMGGRILNIGNFLSYYTASRCRILIRL